MGEGLGGGLAQNLGFVGVAMVRTVLGMGLRVVNNLFNSMLGRIVGSLFNCD